MNARHEISIDSRQMRGDTAALKTASLRVRLITPDPSGLSVPTVTWPIKNRRVTRDEIGPLLDSLHAKYPGCSHREHESTMAVWLNAGQQ